MRQDAHSSAGGGPSKTGREGGVVRLLGVRGAPWAFGVLRARRRSRKASVIGGRRTTVIAGMKGSKPCSTKEASAQTGSAPTAKPPAATPHPGWCSIGGDVAVVHPTYPPRPRGPRTDRSDQRGRAGGRGWCRPGAALTGNRSGAGAEVQAPGPCAQELCRRPGIPRLGRHDHGLEINKHGDDKSLTPLQRCWMNGAQGHALQALSCAPWPRAWTRPGADPVGGKEASRAAAGSESEADTVQAEMAAARSAATDP